MKFKYLVIFLAIISLTILYMISLFSHPVQVPLSGLSQHDGQKVIIKGIVTKYQTTQFGSQLITLRDCDDDTSSVIVYLEDESPVEYGDTIQAIGKVQRYKDQWEVSVSDPQLLTIIQKWTHQSFPLWQLAEHPERYRDTNVNITGIIIQKQKSSFVLTDQTKKYTLGVSCDASRCSHVSDNDAVAVAGRFVYDSFLLHFSLQITEPTHGIFKMEAASYA